MNWLDSLRVALDSQSSLVPTFFRDDDAGWNDDELRWMLDEFNRWTVPIHLAVIPAAVTPRLVKMLQQRIPSAGIHLHQHGSSHTNHESIGRKCEFGASRKYRLQFDDLQYGQRRLLHEFGDRIEPLFTPPWNRCTLDTGRALLELGFTTLSRDHTAAPLGLPGLSEVAVNVDWFASSHGRRIGFEPLGARMAHLVTSGEPLGVMLHHGVTAAEDRVRLSELLQLFTHHPKVVFQPIIKVAGGQTVAAYETTMR